MEGGPMHLRDRVHGWAAVVLAGALLGAVPVVALGAGTTAPAGANPPALSVAPTSLDFGETTLGDFTVLSFTVTNNGATPDVITGFAPSGANPNDFGALPGSNCTTDNSGNIDLAAAASCTILALFSPGALGPRSATLTLSDMEASGASVAVSGVGGIGYYQVGAQGAIGYAGDANFFGDASTTPLNHPIVGMATTGDDGGYWLVASDGGIFNYGPSAGFFGSAGAIALNKPIVGMAPTFDTTGTANGYWLVASDGGIFAYGKALFHGSTGSMHLNKPIVGMAPTPDGGGYWLVASDGGIFNYGTAGFYGSAGSLPLNKPIVGMAPTPDGRGYWLVASDGGVFSYGDAQFYGSTGAIRLAQPIVGMAAMPDGLGYWFSAADGGLFNYGTAPFLGSGVGLGLGQVVGMATDGAPTLQANSDQPALRHLPRHGGWATLPSEPRFAGR
jgi:hypothetical protein